MDTNRETGYIQGEPVFNMAPTPALSITRATEHVFDEVNKLQHLQLGWILEHLSKKV